MSSPVTRCVHAQCCLTESARSHTQAAPFVILRNSEASELAPD